MMSIYFCYLVLGACCFVRIAIAERISDDAEASEPTCRKSRTTCKDGHDGRNGKDGKNGMSIVGPPGRDGNDGRDGIDGCDGALGDTGMAGKDGVNGSAGARGPQGAKGERGDTGASGQRGQRGGQGNPGYVGPQGPEGKPGTPCDIQELTSLRSDVSLLQQKNKVLSEKIAVLSKGPKWSMQDCPGYNTLGKVLQLDASGPSINQCYAVQKDNIVTLTSYNMEMNFQNIASRSGTNFGHIGFVYNMIDEKNYDFVHARVHKNAGRRFQYGYKKAGANIFVKSLIFQGAINGAQTHSLRIEVDDLKTVKVYFDGKQMGSYVAYFDTKSYGGVLIFNGYSNVAQFADFAITSA